MNTLFFFFLLGSLHPPRKPMVMMLGWLPSAGSTSGSQENHPLTPTYRECSLETEEATLLFAAGGGTSHSHL